METKDPDQSSTATSELTPLVGGNETPTTSGDVTSTPSRPETPSASPSSNEENKTPAEPSQTEAQPPAGSALDPTRTSRFIPQVGDAVKYTDANGEEKPALIVAVLKDGEGLVSKAGDVALHIAHVTKDGIVSIARDVRHKFFFTLQEIETSGNFYEYLYHRDGETDVKATL